MGALLIQSGYYLSFSLHFWGTERDTDSDSDLSLEDDQSGSFASTHSSDSEEDEEFPKEPCWENLLCPNNEKLPALSTPKGNARDGFGLFQEYLTKGGRDGANTRSDFIQLTKMFPLIFIILEFLRLCGRDHCYSDSREF